MSDVDGNSQQSAETETVANSLPENGVILLTFLISKRYIPYAKLRKIYEITTKFQQINGPGGNNIQYTKQKNITTSETTAR